MSCPFVAQFLVRLDVDLNRASINFDLIEKAATLKRLDLDASCTDTRVAWACTVGLHAFTTTPSVFPPPARSWKLTDELLAGGPQLLAPQKEHLTVRVTEVDMIDARAGDLVQKRADARELSMLQSLEDLFHAAQRRDYPRAADAFYDFVYRLCKDTERLPEWATRLTEIR